MSELQLESIEPWAPHPTARAVDRTQWRYTGNCRKWDAYLYWRMAGSRIRVLRLAKYMRSLPSRSFAMWIRHAMCCAVRRIGATLDRDSGRRGEVLSWDYLLPEWNGDTVQFSRRLTAPEDAEHLTVRYTFRWSVVGSSEWQLPKVIATEVEESYKPVKICIATGRREDSRPSV